MLHIVTGGSGSGKSVYAETELLRLAKQNNCKKYYIATMEPFGEETLKKIARHREMRKDKGFDTLECYVDLKGTAETLADRPAVLLECMSNLTANELYDEAGNMNKPEKVKRQILEGIQHVMGKTDLFVIVTNEVQGDQMEYSEETKIYQRVLGEVNQSLAGFAEKVTEVVYGIPVEIK